MKAFKRPFSPVCALFKPFIATDNYSSERKFSGRLQCNSAQNLGSEKQNNQAQQRLAMNSLRTNYHDRSQEPCCRKTTMCLQAEEKKVEGRAAWMAFLSKHASRRPCHVACIIDHCTGHIQANITSIASLPTAGTTYRNAVSAPEEPPFSPF